MRKTTSPDQIAFDFTAPEVVQVTEVVELPHRDELFTEIAAVGETVWLGFYTPAQVDQIATELADKFGHIMDKLDILAGIEYQSQRD